MRNRVLVVSVVGPDRPGIVDQVSKVVATHSGNWEESRMARLAGTFAGIVKVSIEDERARGLIDALGKLASSTGLEISSRDAHQPRSVGERRSVRLDLIGADHEGIIRDVSGVLAKREFNIEDLATETVPAPMAGQNLFKAKILVSCPSNVDMSELRDALERLADDLVVEFTIDEKSADVIGRKG